MRVDSFTETNEAESIKKAAVIRERMTAVFYNRKTFCFLKVLRFVTAKLIAFYIFLRYTFYKRRWSR